MKAELFSGDTANIEKIIGEPSQISYLLIDNIPAPSLLGFGEARSLR
jgi:hypothetical protein